MSVAALDYVQTWTHPHVSQAAHALLMAIARLIPEGQTTTPVIAMGELAAHAGVHRRTVWSALPVLVECGEVRVVDGLVGRPARYTLIHVPGAAPPTAVPLPLRADLRPVPPRPRPEVALPLFDAPPAGEDPAIRRSQGSQVLREHPAIKRSHVVLQHVIAWITGITGWARIRSQGSQVHKETTCDPCDPCDPDVGVAGTRARDVLPLEEVQRPPAPPAADSPPRSPPPDPFGAPPCRWFARSHAWCDGRVHVPMEFHREERRKLARRPGETDADLDAQLFARYAQVLAAIPDTAEIPDPDEFRFWKRMLRSAPARAAPQPRAAPPLAVDVDDLAHCQHEPKCYGAWVHHQRLHSPAYDAMCRKTGHERTG